MEKEVKVTWLESAFSFAVMLKDLGDSFECALSNSQGYINDSRRLHCSINPKKLKWTKKTIDMTKRPEGTKNLIKFKDNRIRERVIPVDMFDYMQLWIEQNTKKELYKKAGIQQYTYDTWLATGKIPEKYETKLLDFLMGEEVIKLDPKETKKQLLKMVDDYNIAISDIYNEGNFTRYVLESLIKKNYITEKNEKDLILFLENHKYEKAPDTLEVSRRLNQFLIERKLTHRKLSLAMDCKIWEISKLARTRQASRHFKTQMDEYLIGWGY